MDSEGYYSIEFLGKPILLIRLISLILQCKFCNVCNE